jgi:6-phosphogluconolactonase (cycloisomerase 2 family)
MTASEQQGSVYEFQIDASTGALTQMSGSPFKADVGTPAYLCTMGCGAFLVADPLGRFLFYQFNYPGPSSNGVDTLSVNATDGTLSSNSTILQPAYELSSDPQGRFIYWNATTGDSNAVGAMDVSSAGKLTTAPGEPYSYSGQTSYGSPAVTSSYVFAVNYMDPSSTGSEGELSEWAIDSATGTLTPTINTVPLKLGQSPAITPNGKFLYVMQAYSNNNVFNWEIVPVQVGAGGALTVLANSIQQTTSNGSDSIWISPNGNFLYVSVNGQDLWDYQIDQSTGALTLVQKYTAIDEGDLLAIDPEVKYVFTSPASANMTATTKLAVYSVNPATGALTPLPSNTVDTKVTPISLAVLSPH